MRVASYGIGRNSPFMVDLPADATPATPRKVIATGELSSSLINIPCCAFGSRTEPGSENGTTRTPPIGLHLSGLLRHPHSRYRKFSAAMRKPHARHPGPLIWKTVVTDHDRYLLTPAFCIRRAIFLLSTRPYSATMWKHSTTRTSSTHPDSSRHL